MFPVPQMYAEYNDLDGSPLQNGYIYFGTPNLNPQTDPIPVFWDLEGTLPAPQPLRTLNGYIVNNGTPANIFLSSDYSLSVYNSRRELVYYVQSALEAGAEVPIFNDPIAPTYLKTISDVLNGLEVSLFRFIDPSKYESIRAGTNSDDLIINVNEAFSSGAKKIFVPYGTYNMSSSANIVVDGFGVRGEGVNATIFKTNSTNTAGISIADNLTGITLENFRLTRSALATVGGDGIKSDNSTLNQCLFNRLQLDNHFTGFSLGEGFDCIIDNVLSFNNQLNGIQILGNSLTGNTCDWTLSNVISRNNNGNGIQVTNNTVSLPLSIGNWSNVVSSFNKVYGVNFTAASTRTINDFVYNGGSVIGNGNGGLLLDTFGESINLANLIISLSGRRNCGVNNATAPTLIGNGVTITGSNESVNLNGCVASLNSFHGFSISSLIGGYSSITGCSGLDNGLNTGAGTFAGLTVLNPGGLTRQYTIVGGYYGNSGVNTSSAYGISGIDGSQVTIIGSQLNGNSIQPIFFEIGQGLVTCIGYFSFGGPYGNQIGNIVVGTPTSGGVTPGGINLATNIAKNGTIYSNP